MDTCGDGVLLCGEAEGVPSHWVEDIAACHFFVAADDVGGGVAFWMADMEACAGGVGEHVEAVVFGFGWVEAGVAWVWGFVGLMLVPIVLPAGFDIGGEGGVVADGGLVW